MVSANICKKRTLKVRFMNHLPIFPLRSSLPPGRNIALFNSFGYALSKF